MRCRAKFADRIVVMTDVNPYEPPREPEPLTTGMVVKRGIGVGVIVLLTPLAVGIAGLASCGVVYAIVDTPNMPTDWITAFVFGWLVFLTPPVLALIGMIWWAVRASRRKHEPPPTE